MSKQVYTYSTAESRVNEHRKRVGDDVDTSIEFMQEESLLDTINTLKRQIINAPYSGMEIDRDRKITVPGNGKGWDFMEDDFQFAFKNGTTIEDSIAKGFIGDCTLADTASFENEAGAAVIYDQYGTWDYITYAGMTNPDLTTLGHVTIAHTSGEEIEKLYKLPDNFARCKKLVVAGDEMHEGREDPDRGFFCTYRGFLWMPRKFGISSGVMTYYMQPTTLTDLDETLDIPDILNPVLDNLLDARAFKLGGDNDQLVSDALFAAADALRAAMGYTTSTSNKRIRLARAMPRSPSHNQRGIYRASSFDEGNYD